MTLTPRSLVSQSPALFHLTIRENLTVGFTFGLRPSDEVIWEVLEHVGMKEAVQKLDGMLDARLSTDGLEFSRGEVSRAFEPEAQGIFVDYLPSVSCFVSRVYCSRSGESSFWTRHLQGEIHI